LSTPITHAESQLNFKPFSITELLEDENDINTIEQLKNLKMAFNAK